MMTAATRMFVVMLVMMTAAARMLVVMIAVMVCMFLRGRLLGISGIDHRAVFHCPGDSHQLRNQGIRILRRQTQLLRGKGNDSLLHILVPVEFRLDLRRTVGAVQIFNHIYFSGHPDSSNLF